MRTSRFFPLLFPVALAAAFSQSLVRAAEDAEGKKVSKKEYRSEPARAELSSREYLESLWGRTNRSISDLLKELSETSDKGDRDDIEDVLEVYYYVRSQLASERNRASSPDRLLSVNSQMYRILESLDRQEETPAMPPFQDLFSNVFIGGAFGHKIPNVPKYARDKPVGPVQAKKEAWYLARPDGKGFYSPEELATLSHEQIASLDISARHPAWYTKSAMDRLRGSRISQFEAEIVHGVRKELESEDDLDDDEWYDLASARRVLFLDEVYQSATSPKADTEDAYGVEWKLKWGDEPAVEPMLNRLYLLAGGKETDLTFANGKGSQWLTLVLDEKGATKDDKEDDDERHAVTVEDLSEALYDLYGFDVEPYILDHGVITTGNVGHVLRYHPGEGKKKYKPENLIGRTWVTFRETGVELQPKGFVRRIDGGSMEDVVAFNDRVARGSYLFNLWIQNGDVKWDNNKIYIHKALDDDDDWWPYDHEEGQHDMGLGMGGVFSSGILNKLKPGKSFGSRGLTNLRFKAVLIFKPDCWDATTWADSKWMAEHISLITIPQIRECVATSLWPDFVQEVAVYRLVTRRNRIAELFETTALLDNPGEFPVPNISVPLRNDEEIAAAERKYQLPAGSLKQKLKEGNSPFKRQETLVRNGALASSRNSAIICLLVKHRYPSGLDTRYQRQSDKAPKCCE